MHQEVVRQQLVRPPVVVPLIELFQYLHVKVLVVQYLDHPHDQRQPLAHRHVVELRVVRDPPYYRIVVTQVVFVQGMQNLLQLLQLGA